MTAHLGKLKITFLANNLFLPLSFFLLMADPARALSEPIFLDAIVASIDDKPIALSDVTNRMKPPTKLSVKEASENPDFQRALDAIILEQLVELEAGQRRLTVSDEEITEYLNEIAKRNSLTREEFLTALKRENHSEEEYRTPNLYMHRPDCKRRCTRPLQTIPAARPFETWHWAG